MSIVRTRHAALTHAISFLFSFANLGLLAPAAADCECGYSTTVGDEMTQFVFTDLIETNFQTLDDIAKNTDWVRQAFNMTSTRARGDFGEMFSVDNVRSGSEVSGHHNMDMGSFAGLHLMVQSSPVNDMVPVAEIDSSRLDLWWGSFRTAIKLTDISGTCAAFFWYFNDTQEIDMEFLSKDFHDSNSSYPVNLVLQSRQSATKGFDAQKTKNFITAYLPFNPTVDFHEYRIDFLPGRVLFYADDHLLAQMKGTDVPTSSGHLVLQHWSNGNPLWSGGPPNQDATLTVRYVKAYFNSSRAERQHDWVTRCVDATALGAVCAIPNVASQDTQNASTWFFSDQHNMTNNQTIYGKNSGNSILEHLWRPMYALSFLAIGLMTGM